MAAYIIVIFGWDYGFILVKEIIRIIICYKSLHFEQHTMKEAQNTVKEDDICPICLSVFYKPSRLKTCNHIFCSACIQEASHQYQHTKCALCRKQFNLASIQILPERQAQLQKLYPLEMAQRKAGLKSYRFYRIEVGNTTQVINTQNNNKYRWTLFVKPGPGEHELQKFVQSVQIKLHPTFTPSTIKFSGDQAVEVKRLGWGTFRIDIKIKWKPQFGGYTDTHHDLKFDPLVSRVISCKLGNTTS